MKVGEFLTRAAAWYPNKLALSLVGGDRYTFKQYNDRVNSLSNALLDMGLNPQEKVAVLCHNCCEYMEVIFAAAKTRLVCTAINWRLPPDGIAFLMKDSGAKVLFFSKRFESSLLEQLRPLISADVRLISIEGKIEGMTDYNDLINNYPSSEPETMKSLQDDDVYQILYTSGTTGRMKGVMITNKNTCSAVQGQLVGYSFNRRTHHLLPFPLFHIANWFPIGSVYACYTQSIMAGSFDPSQFLEYVEKEKVTDIGVAVPMMRMLLDHPDFEKRDLSSLKTITIGGSAIPVNLIREIKRRTNCLFFNPYGATECAGSMTYINDQYYGRDASGQVSTRIESVGFPFLQCDVKVFDEEDKECLSRVIGEICVAGDNVMKGYLNMPEQTTAALKNGWYHTGDMGYLDEEGFLYIVDRKSDMIVSGGENIFPAEVEETINSIDGVYDVAVVGLPDQKWVESVTAFIVLKQGAVLTEEMVIDYCKNRIAGYKKPRKVYFVKEIPKNAAGKTLRRDLREQYSKKS